MTPERWKKLDALFHEALALQGEARAAHLAKVCGGDGQLRAEAEKLIAAHERESSFIDSPIFAETAGLTDDRIESPVGRSIGPYYVVSILGRGGMGEVYQAEDTRLERKVAIKVLPAAFTQKPERVRRFEREAKAASALNHPNILTIYEVGEASTEDGAAHYIVSEFVEGDTVRALIERGRLGINESITIAYQVAGALGVAHRAGIIHRDIKPENVMVRPDGLVKVLDFGLAKLTERPAVTPEADSQAEALARLSTEPGVVMGTVSYMSPEQARGQKVDHRTDIFSLGVMLYEMIAGRRPFDGATTSDVIAALLTAEPPPLRQYWAEAPAELERITEKCLAKDREARYQSAKELIAELKTLQTGNQTEGAAATRRVEGAGGWLASRRLLLIAAVAALLIVGLVSFLSWRRAPTVQPDQIKSLAVLPLENLSGDPAQEYFSDGMTEALISNLTQVRALRVISRTSVMRFKGSHKSLAEIARELNVDAVIEGSVRRDGGRVKITARLIQAVNETPLRSFDYERHLADALKLQSEVARAVTDEIRIQLTEEERARLAPRRIRPETHEAYMLGRYHLQRHNEADLKLAIGHFERAIQLDADYAAAWAGLSVAWQQRGIWGAKSFKEVEQPARNAAMKAIELDADSAEAHTSLANIKKLYDWDWAGSEQDYRRAVKLDQGNVETHRLFANLLMALGRHAEAISEIQIAERFDPLSSLVQSDFGRVLYRARNYEQAERHFKRAIELDPLNHGAFSRLGDLYDQMGRYADAIDNYGKRKALLSGIGNDGFLTASLARTYTRMGRRDEALRLLKELQRTTEPAHFHTVAMAAARTALGDKDEAFRLLFNAVEQRDELLTFIKGPMFDGLSSDLRWKELLRRMNFPEEQRNR
ncbi:MAG: protein kinase domain-containing protein [Blastocatellia bacterium]